MTRATSSWACRKKYILIVPARIGSRLAPVAHWRLFTMEYSVESAALFN